MKKPSNRPAVLLAPTADQLEAYNLYLTLIHLKRRATGHVYRTGPRHAQQLADRTASGVLGVAKYKSEQARIRDNPPVRLSPRSV